jgi:hypothetical protein
LVEANESYLIHVYIEPITGLLYEGQELVLGGLCLHNITPFGGDKLYSIPEELAI